VKSCVLAAFTHRFPLHREGQNGMPQTVTIPHTHIMHVSKLVTLTNTLSVLNYRLTKTLGSCVSVVACKTIVNIPDYCRRCRDMRLKPTTITQQRLIKRNETRRSGVIICVCTLSEKMEMNGSGKFFWVAHKRFEIWITKSECNKKLLSQTDRHTVPTQHT
jgi:hypothetical protein